MLTDENDIVVRTLRGREIVRVTIPGSLGRVAAFNVTFLPGDNTKLQDLTVQLHGGPPDHEVEIVESQGVIGFAPNPRRVLEDLDDLGEDDDDGDE